MVAPPVSESTLQWQFELIQVKNMRTYAEGSNGEGSVEADGGRIHLKREPRQEVGAI